jgi:hypothetical protein
LFSGGGQGRGAGVVTRSPHWWPSAPRRCDPGEVWPPSGWSPVARMSGRRLRRSSPCPRPLSAVRTSVQSVKRTSGVHASGVHASGVHATGAIQVSGRTGLRCPRLCRRAVRTALDPGMARCRGPSPLGAMGSTCRRGPRAAWSPARTGPDGKGWCWVGRGGPHEGRRQTWAAASHAHRLRRRPGRLADIGAGPAPGCRSVGWEHENTQLLTNPPGASWQVPAWCPTMGLDREVVTTLCGRWIGDGPVSSVPQAHPVRPGSELRPQRGRGT